MPHHFKWINRATLLFNLASAELVGGWVWEGRLGAHAGGVGVWSEMRGLVCLCHGQTGRTSRWTDARKRDGGPGGPGWGEGSGKAIGSRHGQVSDDCETNGCKRVTLMSVLHILMQGFTLIASFFCVMTPITASDACAEHASLYWKHPSSSFSFILWHVISYYE